MDAQTLNLLFMRFEHRAERITARQVAETFVSVGPLMGLLGSSNNQLMYGRRGTGKTHALRYFQSTRNEAGDLAIYVDAQTIGSNGSIYNDASLPVSERATRLLIDVCSAIHAELLEIFTNPARGWDLSKAVPVLDGFVGGFSETKVVGAVEREGSKKDSATSKDAVSFGTGLKSLVFGAELKLSHEEGAASEDTARVKVSGTEESWIDFNYFTRSIQDLADFVKPKRLWVLIDEWTTIPPEIQPYLADLLRRSMFSVPNITVKIAAIEHRSNFKLDRLDGGYIGFELGADISAAINLDDYLVVDNDEARARHFFDTFVRNHATAIAEEIGVIISEPARLVQDAFTQDNVFLEFVRSSEGVPRDAMYILALAAQKAGAATLSMPIIRSSAYSFFQTEKYAAIQSNRENGLLLDWIRNEVIGKRRTRAFLLPVATDDPIIDRLFDRRALHILNRSRSAAHRPGERFVVYKLDYGLYIDLVNTDRFPDGLLVQGVNEPDVDLDVPFDDARSYRRAILNLSAFYEANPNVRP